MGESKNQNRIHPVDLEDAAGSIRRRFAEIQAKFAPAPNLFRVLVNAPAALERLTSPGAALARGALDEKFREQLAPTIAESSLCSYCLSDTAMAAKTGLKQTEID